MILLRMTGNKLFTLECNQKTPNWTGFCKLTSLKVSALTIIGNCRTILALPTDLNVVYTMMLNVEMIVSNLGHPGPCLTVDKAIKQLGQQTRWHVPFLQDIALRLGGFQRAENFISIIGKRIELSVLKEILEASEICGQI